MEWHLLERDSRGHAALPSVASDLEELRGFRALADFARTPGYARVRKSLDQIAEYAEWDLSIATPLSAIPASGFCVVAWNIERGRQLSSLSTLLKTDPELARADVLLLSESDSGMLRSGNVNIARELARDLGMNYVFANSFFCMDLGDVGERSLQGDNTEGLHGVAVLSRFPIQSFAVQRLPVARNYFDSDERRWGARRALHVRLLLEAHECLFTTAHFEVHTSPAERRDQLAPLLHAGQTERFHVIGADLNTSTYDVSSKPRLLLDILWKMLRFGFEGTVNQYLVPHQHFERKLFELLEREGYGWRAFNDLGHPTIEYDVHDPIHRAKTLGKVPPIVLRWVERRLKPWNGVVGLKLDWFAVKGFSEKGAVPRVRRNLAINGARASDHDPISLCLQFRNP